MRIIFIFCILFSTSLSIPLQADTLGAYFNNKQAGQLLKEQRFPEAEEKLNHALRDAPYSFEVHLNLGVAFIGQGKVEKAQSEYEAALKVAKNPVQKFIAHFNLGEMHGKQKKVDQALQSYQAALDLNPGSIEAKTNIELLIQQQQQEGKGKGQGEGENQDKKDDESEGDGKEKSKNYAPNKPQPKKFKSEKLDQGDVNKILSEIKQQEQKIRAEFNKKDAKEKPNGKDW